MQYSILMGLPGSGKSTWSNDYKQKNKNETYYDYYGYTVKILTCDDYIENNRYRKTYDSLDKFIYGEICGSYKNGLTEIIIDGLFTTNDDIIRVIKALDDIIKPSDSIKIHYWDYDQSQCKMNDLYRRKESSAIDIDNLPYELPDINKIKEGIINDITVSEISIERHEVYKKPIYFIMADKYEVSYDKDKGTFSSDIWVTGGQWGDCWGNQGSISSDEPREFTEFDQLIEKIYPDISFLKYKALKSASISLEDGTDSGYYGSYENYSYYECNLEHLYKMLEEFNLISEEDILNNAK